jgi:putative transposase
MNRARSAGASTARRYYTPPSARVESGSYVESFNGTLRDELLNREIFLSFEEACWVIDRWRLNYNHHRIRSSLDYQTPAAYAAGCVLPPSRSDLRATQVV